MVNRLSVESERPSGKPGPLFLVIPDIFHHESTRIYVIPDICNRESILVSFRMDPRYQPAGMTTGLLSA